MNINGDNDSKSKFTGRADAYAKYRPSYPDEFISYLFDKTNEGNITIADIGAGTGILTRRILEHEQAVAGIRVYAVEPNPEMRMKCALYCNDYPGCTVIDGSAEDTKLPEGCANLVTAAQAFHWFDKLKARDEFRRIVKPGGKVVLVWNRRDEEDPFIKEYEELIKDLCPAYKGTAGGLFGDYMSALDGFFKNNSYEIRKFNNSLHYTLESLKGYFMSTSYAPPVDSPEWEKYDRALTELYRRSKDSQGKILYRMASFSYTGEV